jgi:hypothetical protein
VHVIALDRVVGYPEVLPPLRLAQRSLELPDQPPGSQRRDPGSGANRDEARPGSRELGADPVPDSRPRPWLSPSAFPGTAPSSRRLQG